MNGIRTNAAAVMLGISPNTLRSWERRYGFPKPQRSAGGHRQYSLTEIEALRLTLAETHNVSSAISLARERGEGPSTPSRLTAAFTSFDEDGANRMLEESLGLRSVERTIEEVLLDAVTSLFEPGVSTAEYEFAWRHAVGWLSAQRRLAPPATRREGAMIFDASSPCDLDAIYAQALEVVLRRAGVRTLSLTPSIELHPAGPGAARAQSRGGHPHRAPRLAGLDRPPRLRGALGRARGGRLRLPQRRSRHRGQHGVPARRPTRGRPRRPPLPSRAGQHPRGPPAAGRRPALAGTHERLTTAVGRPRAARFVGSGLPRIPRP